MLQWSQEFQQNVQNQHSLYMKGSHKYKVILFFVTFSIFPCWYLSKVVTCVSGVTEAKNLLIKPVTHYNMWLKIFFSLSHSSTALAHTKHSSQWVPQSPPKSRVITASPSCAEAENAWIFVPFGVLTTSSAFGMFDNVLLNVKFCIWTNVIQFSNTCKSKSSLELFNKHRDHKWWHYNPVVEV